MSYRDEAQHAAVCRALLTRVGLGDLWTDTGPTPRALELLAEDGGGLSSGERTLLLAAFALWNNHRGLRFTELLRHLDDDNLKTIGELLAAIARGPEGIDAWLADWSEPRPFDG
jgi:hypothetical protein